MLSLNILQYHLQLPTPVLIDTVLLLVRAVRAQSQQSRVQGPLSQLPHAALVLHPPFWGSINNASPRLRQAKEGVNRVQVVSYPLVLAHGPKSRRADDFHCIA